MKSLRRHWRDLFVFALVVLAIIGFERAAETSTAVAWSSNVLTVIGLVLGVGWLLHLLRGYLVR